NINAFTLHTLIQRDPRWILRSPKYWRAIFLEKKFNPRWLSRSAEYWRGLYLQKHLDNGFNIRKLKIITLVREPVARNVSDFFKRASPLIDLLIQKKIDLKSLRTYFLENFPHEMTLNWFDVELKQMIGLDVYSVPFPKKTGYKIYKGGDTHPDVLLLKLEKLNECASRAFKEFLGIDEFILQNKIPVGRRYYQSYKKFVSIKMLPQSYIEKMYTSKYAKHFYTDTELNEYRKKWGQWY
ncbi:MAG: putative capsular polysaccharide synthesis family protein, partial [Candidatus Hodarchaeota archaeon]